MTDRDQLRQALAETLHPYRCTHDSDRCTGPTRWDYDKADALLPAIHAHVQAERERIAQAPDNAAEASMHDPMVLLYGSKHVDLWHVEPDGHDSAEVCGHAPHGWRRLLWTVRHVQHLLLRFWPYMKVKRWLRDRCGECGRRFLWRDARHGYQSSATPKDFGEPDVPLGDEYEQHARERADAETAKVREKADRGYEQAKQRKGRGA